MSLPIGYSHKPSPNGQDRIQLVLTRSHHSDFIRHSRTLGGNATLHLQEDWFPRGPDEPRVGRRLARLLWCFFCKALLDGEAKRDSCAEAPQSLCRSVLVRVGSQTARSSHGLQTDVVTGAPLPGAPCCYPAEWSPLFFNSISGIRLSEYNCRCPGSKTNYIHSTEK